MESPQPIDAIPARFRQPKPWLRWGLVALAVLGWWLSLQLLLAASNFHAQSALLDTLCGRAGAPGGWDCRSVLASHWGSIPLSTEEGGLALPVAALGMAYFAFVALWYLFVGPPTHDRRAYHLIVAAVVLAGVLTSVDFIRIMAFELHRWCLGCLAVHATNGALLLGTLVAWPWRKPAQPSPSHPTGRLALATLTAGVLIGFLHLTIVFIAGTGGQMRRLSDAYLKIADDPEYVVWNYRRQPVAEIPLCDDEPLLGAPGSPAAPNLVVVFSDFQCPQCRKAHELLDELLQSHPDQLRVIFRQFPQDPACNPHPEFSGGGHPAACRAARAYEAALAVGGTKAALAMQRVLFERHGELDLDRFADWAAELGLDRAAFTQALESPAVAERIAADVALGNRLGVAAVPALFLNGRRLDRWSRPTTWDALLAAEHSP